MPQRTCSIEGCERTARALGWCQKHYRRQRPPDPEQRERNRQRANTYRDENIEKVRQRDRERYAANRDRKLQYQKQYAAANREQINAYLKNYQATNRDKLRAQKAEYCATNRERLRKRRREYYAANRDRLLADMMAAYYKDRIENPDKIRAKNARVQRVRRARQRSVPIVPFTTEQWLAKIAYWGDRCWTCRGHWSEVDHVKPDTWLSMVVAVRDDTAPTLNRTVMISAFCPICAEHRGPPHPVRECGPGGWCWVDVWTNPCGHVDTQEQVLAEEGLQCEYPGCTLAVFDGPDYPYCSPDCAAAGPHRDGAAIRIAHRAWRHRLVGSRQLMVGERERMVAATRRLAEARRSCR